MVTTRKLFTCTFWELQSMQSIEDSSFNYTPENLLSSSFVVQAQWSGFQPAFQIPIVSIIVFVTYYRDVTNGVTTNREVMLYCLCSLESCPNTHMISINRNYTCIEPYGYSHVQNSFPLNVHNILEALVTWVVIKVITGRWHLVRTFGGLENCFECLLKQKVRLTIKTYWFAVLLSTHQNWPCPISFLGYLSL